MKCSLIDIGSNSIRLTVYEITGIKFKALLHSKIMAGLAGYIEENRLTQEGIDVALEALSEYRTTIHSIGIEQVSVFATASLRNIINSAQVVSILNSETGFNIEVLSEEEEAMLGYNGARLELPEITDGAFTDIGGASTEFISFENNNITSSVSYKVGSLNLYKKYVKNILPNESSMLRISEAIDDEFFRVPDFSFSIHTPLICVGGTARAVMKIARKIYSLSEDCNTLTADQVDNIFDFLVSNKKRAAHLILRMTPDRIHTIIPGLSILTKLIHICQAKEVIVCNHGIREGFICKKIIQSETTNTYSRRTEN